MGDARLPFKAAIEAHTEKEEREKAEAEKRAKEKAEAEAQAKAQRQQMFAQYQQTTLNPAAAGFGLTPFPGQPQQMVYFPIPTAEQPPAQVTQPVVEQPKPVEKKEKQQHHDDDDEDAEMGDDDEDGDEFKDTKKSSKKSKKGKRGGKKSAILSSVPRDKIFFKRLNVLVNVAKAEKPLSKLEILNFDDNILLFLGNKSIQTELTLLGNLKRPEGDSATPGKSKRGGKKLDVKYDEQGKPIYPINVCGVLSILNLGTIEDSSGFQKDKHILPVGYVTREKTLFFPCGHSLQVVGFGPLSAR